MSDDEFEDEVGDEELEEAEPGHAKRMQEWLDAEGEIGASYAQDVWLGGKGEPVPRVWAGLVMVARLLAKGAGVGDRLAKSR